MGLDLPARSTDGHCAQTFVSGSMAEEEEPSTGTPLWGAGSSADAVGQQTNEEAPGAAMRRVAASRTTRETHHGQPSSSSLG